jgi:hypothetical protein
MAVRMMFISLSCPRSSGGRKARECGLYDGKIKPLFQYRSLEDPMSDPADAPLPRILTEAARRALAEAEARRREYDAAEADLPVEKGGRGGRDPARYGDWEVKGRASDF